MIVKKEFLGKNVKKKILKKQFCKKLKKKTLKKNFEKTGTERRGSYILHCYNGCLCVCALGIDSK